MKENVKFYVCKKSRLYQYLLENGFVPYETRPDRNNPKYNVWIFFDSDKLQNSITEYYKNLSQLKATN